MRSTSSVTNNQDLNFSILKIQIPWLLAVWGSYSFENIPIAKCLAACTLYSLTVVCRKKDCWMSRHESCSLYVDNFTFAQFGIDCPTCSALGEVHLGGSHPHRPLLATQLGNYPVPINSIVLFPSHICNFEFPVIYLIIELWW